jgi:hypothetical protein
MNAVWYIAQSIRAAAMATTTLAAPLTSLGAASVNSGAEGEAELGEIGTPVEGDAVPVGVAMIVVL